MRSIIKTAVIAAIGVAVISGSPALAAKRSDARAQAYSTVSGDWQTQLEYLKDAPAHNGNNY